MDGAPRATRGKKLLLILFGVGVAVAALALAEGVLALLGIGDDLRYEDPYVGFEPGSDLFVKSADGKRYETSPGKLEFFNPQSFAAVKPPGSLRVFALGGSTTAGRPYDDKVAFAHWLQLYLEDAEPGRRHEVVNAGAISYASYRIVLLMRELVRYSPDVFVVYTGHNEFLEERSYSDLIGQPGWWKRLRLWLGQRRFFALARHAWHRPPPAGDATAQQALGAPSVRLAGEVKTKLEGWTGLERYQRNEALAASIVEHFAFNLHQMAAIARAHGVRLIFVEPVSNLKDFSPFKSQHGDGLNAEQRATAQRLLAEGRALLERDDAAALARLDEALAIDPLYAESHFRAGRARLALGERAGARAAFERARDLDVAPLRATGAILAALREVADDEGVPLVPLPALLADRAEASNDEPGGALPGSSIPGNELLLDHVHPNLDVHALIAETLLERLATERVVEVRADWDERDRERIHDALVASLDPAYYAQRDLNLATVLGWAGKIEEARAPLERAAAALPDNPQARLHLGIVYQRRGQLTEALAELNAAAALAPDAAIAHFNLGVVLGKLGRTDDGIAALRRALELKPAYPEALFNLGILLRRNGRLDEAVHRFQQALELLPGAAETHRALGIALRRQGRLEDAAHALERALELAPDDPQTLTELGITRALQGRAEEAGRRFDRALEVEPSHAEALYNRALLAAQRGDRAAAEAGYRAALAAQPTHAPAANNLAILLAGQGDLETARTLLDQAIASDPTYAEAHFNLGIVLDGSGQPQAAARAIERAIELAPATRRFHQALAALYQALGDPRAAAQADEARQMAAEGSP